MASQGFYELIKASNLIFYPDADMRLAISRAVAIETSRGWRIAKEKQSHKIDLHRRARQAATPRSRLRAGPSRSIPMVAPFVVGLKSGTVYSDPAARSNTAGIPSHYLKQNQEPEPWRNFIDASGNITTNRRGGNWGPI